MLALLVALLGAASPLPQTADVELRIHADARVWVPGEPDTVLVEVRNPNAFPVVLPPLRPRGRSIRLRLRTDRGEFSPKFGTMCMGMTESAWRTIGFVLPPGRAFHFAYETDSLTQSSWKSLPVHGELVAQLVVDADFLASVQMHVPPGAVPVFGTFEAGLACRVGRVADSIWSTEARGALRDSAKALLQSLSRRQRDRTTLDRLRAMSAEELGRFGKLDRLRELESLDLGVSQAEIHELAARFPAHPRVDDVWYQFVRHPIWKSRPEAREQLVATLLRERPGSTGAIRAASWLAWPDSWDLFLVVPTGHPGTPAPGGGPQPHPNPVEDPYPLLSGGIVIAW